MDKSEIVFKNQLERNIYYEKLQKDENFFLTIFQSIPTSINVINSKCEIIMCNSSTYTMFGFKSEKEYIEKFEELSPKYQPTGELTKEAFLKYVREAHEVGQKDVEWMHCDKSGNPMPVNIKFVSIDGHDEYGGKLLIAFLQDMRGLVKEKKINTEMKAILDATPLCVNLWNLNLDHVMCNKKAVELFDLENEQQYIERFFELSPKYQPNKELSDDKAKDNIIKAFETGYCKFKWLHCKLDGEEIPTEIILEKVVLADNDQVLVAGFTRDLRGKLVGNIQAGESDFDDYFFDRISDKKLFNTVAELSDELFFVLDIKKSLVQYFGEMSKTFNIDNKKLVFPEMLIKSKLVYDEDIPVILKMAKNIKDGIVEAIDIRLNKNNNEPQYFKILYKIIQNKKNEPTFAIGKMIDIHDQKLLEVKSRTDLLTNCYNKITTENEVSIAISKDTDNENVLFIADIDQFKEINDNLGHYFGDLVLSEVSSSLKACFRSQDIVGRIGGDEFIVFAKEMPNISVIMKKADSILKSFDNTYVEENKSYRISASIGIARYPQDGTTYEELYKAADKALYQSKKRGKDCFTIYNKDLLKGTIENRTILENANRDTKRIFDVDIISKIFDLLYDASNIYSSINAVLKLLGTHLNVDRCYIFESFDEGVTYNNTYEWCRADITQEIDNLQKISKSVLADFFSNANNDGIIYNNDLLEQKFDGVYKLILDQNIKSFLHSQTKSNGIIKNFLGVDDCCKTRIWSEKEVNVVTYATKILSTFLLIANKK